MKRRRFITAIAAAPVAPALLAQQQTPVSPATPAAPAPVGRGGGRGGGGRGAQVVPQIELTELDAVGDTTPKFFTAAQFAALRKLSGILLPPLKGSPGALDTDAPEFLDFLIGVSPVERQQLYRNGLDYLNAQAHRQFGKAFAEIDAAQADVLIIGSGHSGGMAAKILTEKGISCLMLNAGPVADARKDTEIKPAYTLPFRGFKQAGDSASRFQANEFNANTWVDEKEVPYTLRSRASLQLGASAAVGGRSLFWSRQSFRLSDYEFKSKSHDGYGDDWPIDLQGDGSVLLARGRRFSRAPAVWNGRSIPMATSFPTTRRGRMPADRFVAMRERSSACRCARRAVRWE
jgi:hypothetical protein